MKSIPLALTWEFWRLAWLPLLATIAFLVGVGAVLYKSLHLSGLYTREAVPLTSLHAFCFIFVVAGLSAAICQATASPQYRFTLPLSIQKSILVPAINGAIAVVIGYLTIALLLNWLFSAQWTLVKPSIIAVCMLSLCQAAGWMIWSLPTLRGGIVAGISTVLGVGVLWLNANHVPERFDREWHTIRPIDVSLAIIVPTSAYLISFVLLNLARRGQVVSMTAIGRWLLAKLDVSFVAGKHADTPMAAELWSEWIRRGRAMPAGPFLITITLCCFFLSGRFEWQSAFEGIVAFTWLQLMSGSILGLFIGHVGERFDFHEHLATRPLSDIQLADVKLWNTWKSVCWTWITWAVGVAVMVACLAIVGQGPTSWNGIVPPGTHPVKPVVLIVMLPLCSWTLTSLAVSVVILRPWMVKTVFVALTLLPFVPITMVYLRPDLEYEIAVALLGAWICAAIGGTGAIYATAFRLRLITAKRIALVGLGYLLFCATWMLVARFPPPAEMPRSLAIGLLLSACMLPFVGVAAVPLAIWWNRHR